jgi:hypothetical protein
MMVQLPALITFVSVLLASGASADQIEGMGGIGEITPRAQPDSRAITPYQKCFCQKDYLNCDDKEGSPVNTTCLYPANPYEKCVCSNAAINCEGLDGEPKRKPKFLGTPRTWDECIRSDLLINCYAMPDAPPPPPVCYELGLANSQKK